MAEPGIPERYLIAGSEYLERLIALGLRPEGLFWGMNALEMPDLQLFLVTSFVDGASQREVYELLVAAYQNSLTPKEIDPFMVALLSPRHALAGLVRENINLEMRKGTKINYPITVATYSGEENPLGNWVFWIYGSDLTEKKPFNIDKKLSRFRENVLAQAA